MDLSLSRQNYLILRNIKLGLVDILYSKSRAFLFILDLIMSSIFFILASWLGRHTKFGEYSPELYTSCVIFSISFVMFAVGMGYYEKHRRFSLPKFIIVGFIATCLATLTSLSVTYLYFYDVFGRLPILYGALGAYCGLSLIRTSLGLVTSLIPTSVVFLGESKTIDETIALMHSDEFYRFSNINCIKAHQILGTNNKLDFNKIKKAHLSDLVVTAPSLDNPENIRIAFEAISYKVKVTNELEFYALQFERLPTSSTRSSWLLTKEHLTRNYKNEFTKRLLDLLISITGLIILMPLFVAIALMIKISSQGSIFFVQPRQGRFNKPFDMYKFRTMYAESSCRKASGGFTKTNDSRITAIGRILRPLHLDELPQLFNILKGDMSLVGPRPEALNFAKAMSEKIPTYDFRYLLRPGLTGHAQIQCGYMQDTTEDTITKLSYDLYYVSYGTILFDLRILIRTIFVVLKSCMR